MLPYLHFAVRCCPALLILGSVALAASSPRLSYADLGAAGAACCVVPDGAGDVYVVAGVTRDSDTDVSITKFDSANHVVGSFSFGGGADDQPMGAALDAQGNLVIVGNTLSVDFPLVGALISQTEPNANAAFIVKVNPINGRIVFSTKLGGVAPERRSGFGTVAGQVALDPLGNIYVTGATNATDFPVTANAFQKTGAGVNDFNWRPFAFIAKLSPNGDRLLYSTLLGGSVVNCFGGSHCIGVQASTSATAITVDAAGSAIVAGSTNALDFPVTAGAFQTQCRCREYVGNGFVAKLNAEGSGLAWATFLGGSPSAPFYFPSGDSEISSVSLGPAGSVIVAGTTGSLDFPVTPGALQSTLANPPPDDQSPQLLFLPPINGFVSELNAQGSALLFSTYIGDRGEISVNAIAADPAGNLWLTGFTQMGSFIDELSAGASSLLQSRQGPNAVLNCAVAFDSSKAVWVLGTAGSVLQFSDGQLGGSGVLGVADSAAGGVGGEIAPGEFVSFYGSGLGPSPVQVFFDGIPAPLLYARDSQINVLVPYGVAGKTTSVQVNSPAASVQFSLHVKPSHPQVFATVLNQDGTVNSPQNRAADGSIVTIYASGAGLLEFGAPVDGAVFNAFNLDPPMLPVAVLGDLGWSLEVLYAGPATGSVINALQVNFRLPQKDASSFRLAVGEGVSDPFTIWARPIGF